MASAFDAGVADVTGATIVAPPTDPTGALMSGWLATRLGIEPRLEPTTEHPRLRTVELTFGRGERLSVVRENGNAVFSRTGQVDRNLPLVPRPLGDELAEELRRLDPDQIYADSLGTFAGMPDLNDRPAERVHVWSDPVEGAA